MAAAVPGGRGRESDALDTDRLRTRATDAPEGAGGTNTLTRIDSKKPWGTTFAASIMAVFGLTLFTTSSSPAKGDAPTTKIKMVIDGGLVFTGPDTIEAGSNLKIINQTSVGPHFFSLFEEGSLPTTAKENTQCANLDLPACKNVARAHDISKRSKVKKRTVDKGRDGWDKSFSGELKGDSWYTDSENQSQSRVVTAAPGSTLYYLCVIHPETMRGSIQVTEPAK